MSKITTQIDELEVIDHLREQKYYNEQGLRTWTIPPKHIFVRSDYPTGGFYSLGWGPIPNETVLGIGIVKLPKLDK